jgi:hypothetical protein
MTYGNFEITCKCGCKDVNLIHRTKDDYECYILECILCGAESEL